jgi:hypothetical protein
VSDVEVDYLISRGVDDTSQVFVRVEFGSTEDAVAFRERPMESGAIGRPLGKDPSDGR